MSHDAQEQSRADASPVELYKFTMLTQTWRYASGDQARTGPDDELYAPATIRRTAQDFSQEDTAANIEVAVAFDNPVAQLFRDYTPPASVVLVIYRFHLTDDEDEVVAFGPFSVVSVRFAGGEATLTCAPIQGALARKIPSVVYQSLCNWTFGGPGCGVDPDDWSDEAELDSVVGVTLVSTIFDTRDDGFYRSGWIERTNGERRFIVAHVGNTLTLSVPFPATLEAGETVTAFAGCAKTEAACTAFGNLLQHMGFPRVPSRNPYGGGSIV